MRSLQALAVPRVNSSSSVGFPAWKHAYQLHSKWDTHAIVVWLVQIEHQGIPAGEGIL